MVGEGVNLKETEITCTCIYSMGSNFHVQVLYISHTQSNCILRHRFSLVPRPSVQYSLIPRLSRNVNMYRGESQVSFVCKHDVIKIGSKQKGKFFAHCSTNYAITLSVYDIQCPIARYM